MGKQPVRMKAVMYALSPFQQKVMSGLWKDLPAKLTQSLRKLAQRNSPPRSAHLRPRHYQEKEKLEHRY